MRKSEAALSSGLIILHNLSNINTGDRRSVGLYLATVCIHTDMKSRVSASVPRGKNI